MLDSPLTQRRALFPSDAADLGALTSFAPLRQGIAHVSKALCHGTALGAAIPVASSSSVSWFHTKKSLCDPSLQALRGVTPGLRACCWSHEIILGFAAAPCLIPGWNPVLPTRAAPSGPLSLWTCSAVFLLISCLLISRSHRASCHRYCSPAG